MKKVSLRLVLWAMVAVLAIPVFAQDALSLEPKFMHNTLTAGATLKYYQSGVYRFWYNWYADEHGVAEECSAEARDRARELAASAWVSQGWATVCSVLGPVAQKTLRPRSERST